MKVQIKLFEFANEKSLHAGSIKNMFRKVVTVI